MKKTICLTLLTVACSFVAIDASAQSPAEKQKLEVKQILQERGITLQQYLSEKGLKELPVASTRKVEKVERSERAVSVKDLHDEFPNDPVVKSIMPNNKGNVYKNAEKVQLFKTKDLPTLKNERVKYSFEKNTLKKAIN